MSKAREEKERRFLRGFHRPCSEAIRRQQRGSSPRTTGVINSHSESLDSVQFFDGHNAVTADALARRFGLTRPRSTREPQQAPAVTTITDPITILAADDHPLIRAGLEAAISLEPDMRLVAEAADGEEAIARYREHRPAIVLMDLRMPKMDGLTAIKTIIAEFPEARIIALTTYEGDEDIYRALSAGAKGYILKDMLRTELLHAIRAVHNGKKGIPVTVAARLAEHTPRIALTEREREVLQLVAKGLSNREIGAVLGRTEGTIKIHLKAILEKLDAEDRTEAVTIALQRGFLHID
jgi:DNA-binding NarL/FixJ family response regulator